MFIEIQVPLGLLRDVAFPPPCALGPSARITSGSSCSFGSSFRRCSCVDPSRPRGSTWSSRFLSSPSRCYISMQPTCKQSGPRGDAARFGMAIQNSFEERCIRSESSQTRYLRAIDLNPGVGRVPHHSTILEGANGAAIYIPRSAPRPFHRSRASRPQRASKSSNYAEQRHS